MDIYLENFSNSEILFIGFNTYMGIAIGRFLANQLDFENLVYKDLTISTLTASFGVASLIVGMHSAKSVSTYILGEQNNISEDILG